QLTPVALAQAMALSKHLVHNAELQLPYQLIPSAVFTQPTFATVGMTEQEAIRARTPVDIYTSEFKPLKHTVSGSAQRALLKLVVCSQTQKVLGAHMVGEHADEIIQGLAVALTAGATKQHFDRTLGIHPTLAEEFVTMRELKRRV
ncbi:MAG TPA: glutathione-disulfide reductase, partial [Pseudomonadales bacterium]|nr:glutathione-disulfide reductase [Pseudomonadales bacterium]